MESGPRLSKGPGQAFGAFDRVLLGLVRANQHCIIDTVRPCRGAVFQPGEVGERTESARSG